MRPRAAPPVVQLRSGVSQFTIWSAAAAAAAAVDVVLEAAALSGP
jgi:hypothetical protein